jgi:DNA helicase II / ATP-dependent DNA helicase PcrA
MLAALRRASFAHRVAHLIVQRANPRRMMLLTFSRRAAAEMSRRVKRIAVQVLPEHGRLMVDALVRDISRDRCQAFA